MNRHLVTVEVGVVSGTNQWVNPDRVSFDENRLKCLDGKTVQGGSPVQQNGVSLGHFFENIPNLGSLPLDQFLGASNRVDVAHFLEPTNDEWLEKHQRHLLGQPALVQFQIRSNHDDGTSRVIDSFSEKVLAKTSAFAFQHVGKRFQSAISGSGDGATVTTVVEKSVDRFLKHPFLVSDNHIRRLELEQILEAVVPVDDATVKVVQIRGGKTSAFQRNERTKIRRNHRKHFQNHPLWTGFRGGKSLNQLESLGQFFPDLLGTGFPHRGLEFHGELGEIGAAQEDRGPLRLPFRPENWFPRILPARRGYSSSVKS